MQLKQLIRLLYSSRNKPMESLFSRLNQLLLEERRQTLNQLPLEERRQKLNQLQKLVPKLLQKLLQKLQKRKKKSQNYIIIGKMHGQMNNITIVMRKNSMKRPLNQQDINSQRDHAQLALIR